MITVSWQPGALRGYSIEQTSQMIVRGLQMWMSLTQIKFGSVPNGAPANIQIYPYSGNMNGAYMATYMATRQVLYTTQLYADREFNIMAFAHEFGHCFGLGHVERPGALMYTRGSVDRYFDTIEAPQQWSRFGKFTRNHWPWSLSYLGNQVRELRAVAEHADARWKHYRNLRDKETDVEKRKAYDKTTRQWLTKRREAYAELKRVSDRWLSIKSQWESIGGIRQNMKASAFTQRVESHAEATTETSICECFHHVDEQSEFSMSQHVDLQSVFDRLPNKQEPLRLAEVRV